MLTISKPTQYGYKPVYDLPTPPSTSRPSPPLTYLELGQRPPLSTPGGGSPSDQLMSASHRGLPPPAALPPVPPPPGSGPSQPPSGLLIGPPVPPPPPSQSQALGQLPSAPLWHEESMRVWLVAKAEEDKRRQEEERTRQEGYRLEQRRMEHEILRTSLQGGIPPPLVPVVFAGMGGGALSPAALEWAQQFMMPQSPQTHPPALMPPGGVSSEHQRRDSQAQAYGQYTVSVGVPSTPGSAQGPPAAYSSGYPGSPTRPRGQSMPGVMAPRSLVGGGANLPNLNTNVPGGPAAPPTIVHAPGLAQAPPPPPQQQQQQQQQQEPQASPSIYFHHWQPPATQAGGRGGTDQPATPSVGESPRKRKAPGPQQPAPPPTTTTTQRHRSPPFSHSTGLSNPPPGRRRGHSRQRSDLGSSYRPGGRGRGASAGPGREMSPMHTSGASSARDSGEPSSTSGQHPQQQQQQQQQPQVPPFVPPPAGQLPPARTGAHPVSSLLSDTPQSPQVTTRFVGGAPEPPRHHHHHHHHHHHPPTHLPQQQFGENERRTSPRSSEEKLRGGGGGGQNPTATRPGDNVHD